MKLRLGALIWITLIIAAGTAKAQLKWNIFDESNSDSQIHTYIGESESGYGFIYKFPNGGIFKTKSGIAYRYYDKNGQIVRQMGLPDGTPPFLNIFPFSKHVAIVGTGNPGDQDSGEAVLMITDREGNLELRRTWKLENERHHWLKWYHTYTFSSDSSYLMIDFVEHLVPENRAGRVDFPKKHYLTVYDRDLKVVFEKTYTTAPGEHKRYGLFNYSDFSKDDGIINYTATNEKISCGICRQDADSCESIVDFKILPKANSKKSSAICFHTLTSDNKFVGFGYTIIDNLILDMFFSCKDLSSSEKSITKYYRLDKAFEEKYPFFGKKHQKFPFFRYIYPVNDGIIAFGESVKPDSFTILDLYMIKFNFEGGIEWIKKISKDNVIGSLYDSELLCRVFLSGDDFIVFYMDNPKNIMSNEMIPGPRMKYGSLIPATCLAYARINSNGEVLERKIVNDHKDAVVYSFPGQIYQADADTYIITSTSNSKNAIAIYTPEEK